MEVLLKIYEFKKNFIKIDIKFDLIKLKITLNKIALYAGNS